MSVQCLIVVKKIECSERGEKTLETKQRRKPSIRILKQKAIVGLHFEKLSAVFCPSQNGYCRL